MPGKKPRERVSWMALTLVAFLLLLGSGCSTYERDWKKASAQPPSPQAITGAWTGTWQSEKNGHAGALRCLLELRPDGQYNARFHAKYRKILGFSYTAVLAIEPADSNYVSQGSADLGWYAGGLYSYQGELSPTNFSSSYTSKYDQGIFLLRRPAQ